MLTGVAAGAWRDEAMAPVAQSCRVIFSAVIAVGAAVRVAVVWGVWGLDEQKGVPVEDCS